MNTTAIVVGVVMLLAFALYLSPMKEVVYSALVRAFNPPAPSTGIDPPSGQSGVFDPSMPPGSMPPGSMPPGYMPPNAQPGVFDPSMPPGYMPPNAQPGEFDPSTPPGFGVPPAATSPPGEFDPSTPPGFTPPDPSSLGGLSSSSGNPYCDIKFNPFAPNPNPSPDISRTSYPSTIEPLEPNFKMGLSSY